ncbi:15-cis-zeta-carotene isomerase [Hibiscus syriacus]|uniref:15-cis-zeta-carotene isomerase n=1 Tax=Hibiscus syriacus TaxID=106335 RepID=A0A6A3ABC9_HIBSY|nr:15-cis-zeta-carotene isomerase [Hibiscus syriacus]
MFAVSADQKLQCAAPRPVDRKWKSIVERAPNCPSCASANTKFCYYNNYSLSQPRLDKNGGQVQVSINYSKNSSSLRYHEEQMIGISSSSDGDSAIQPAPSIDLAVIFSQFLNQSTSLHQPEILTQAWPNEGTDPRGVLEQDTNIQNDSSMECPELPVVHPSLESYLLQEMPQVMQHLKEDDSSVEGFVETDEMNAFGLQNLLAEEMVQDVFWSNPAANTPSFEYQPMVQLQQWECFPVDDRLTNSANFMAENWSVFDFSGFELFSKN